MKKYCFVFFIFFSCTTLFAQEQDSVSTEEEFEYTNLEEAIQNPLAVKKLNLSYQEDFPSEKLEEILPKLENLLSLDISGNQLKELPQGIGALKNLTSLNCSNNQLKILPTEIGALKNLTDLNCSNNQLKILPTEIGALKNLTTLDCYDNQLTELPKEIGELENLLSLNCPYNQLKSLPTEIGTLKNLKTLDCYDNRLTDLPKEIGELDSLSKLVLSYNQLKTLPKEIGTLKNLTIFYCSDNQLTELPKEIEAWEKLEGVYIPNNQLKILPREIGAWKNLKEFSCASNQLTTLPKEIGELTALVYFYCSDNKLTNLPKEIVELKNLIVFEYYSNPLVNFSKEYFTKEFHIDITTNLAFEIAQLYINENGEKIFQQFKKAYEKYTKSDTLKVKYLNTLLYGAWWYNQKGKYIQAEENIQRIFQILRKHKRKQGASESEADKNLNQKLSFIEGQTRSVDQSIERGLKITSQRNTAIIVGIVAILLGIFAVFQSIVARREKAKADKLLLNILPQELASELKKTGKVPAPRAYQSVSVMFTDYSGFTEATTRNPMEVVLRDLNECFVTFDRISANYGIEKIKTIGDAFMCAKGLPTECNTHAVDMVLAGLEMQRFMVARKKEKDAQGEFCFQCRLGINSGNVIAGIVGERKFCYDIWGNTVNTANRMELSGKVERVNISSDTMELVKDFFALETREPVEVKGKGVMQLYFVSGIKPELSEKGEGIIPNQTFKDMYLQKYNTIYQLPI